MPDQPTPENAPQWIKNAAQAIEQADRDCEYRNLPTDRIVAAILRHAPQPSAEAGKLADELESVAASDFCGDWEVERELMRASAAALRARDSAVDERDALKADNAKLHAELARAEEENEFHIAAMNAFEWQRINAMSAAEVEKELLEAGYTKERLDAGLAKIRATVETAIALRAARTATKEEGAS